MSSVVASEQALPAVAPAVGWTVYILRCADGTLYTGIAMDLQRRVGEHNSGDRLAARYTRTRRPVSLVYREPAQTRSAAARREYQIKRLSRQKKEALLLAAGLNQEQRPQT